jgi:CHASE3 domain sensor protein|tara:strand:+ start:982 stop:1428 length:447 start_codon:yes stop_codon:yes gene_type:complete
MVDPISILGGLSAGIKAGKQLYALKNQVVDFFDAVDDAKAKHAKKKNSIFAGSNEQGLATYLDAMAARDAEEQLRELIVNTRGLSSYQELQKIRQEIRQERKAAEAQRQIERQKRAEAALTVAVIVVAAIALFGGMYLFAIYMGWLSF